MQHELERIAELLESCLQHIDESAATVLEGRVAADPEKVMAGLQAGTERLRSLLHALFGNLEGPLDLSRATEEAVDGLLRRLEVPLVIRTTMQDGLPPVAWPRQALQSGLGRALQLAASHAGPGGEVAVTTRVAGDLVLFELTASGRGDRRVLERSDTLRAFVDELEGRCVLDVDDLGRLHLRIELKSGARV